MGLNDKLIEDLKAELEITDINFNLTLLEIKVKNAISDVKRVRKYPSTYSEEKITDDMESLYSICRALALYDYNKMGADYETSHTENGVTSKFTDRDKLLGGVIPLSRF